MYRTQLSPLLSFDGIPCQISGYVYATTYLFGGRRGIIIVMSCFLLAHQVATDHVITFSFSLFQNFQLLRTAHCTSDNFRQFREAVNIYTSILHIFFFVLTFLTLRINMKIFRREGKLSFLAAALVLFPVPIFIVIYSSTIQEQNQVIVLWTEFIMGSLIPTIVMVLLFLPNVSVYYQTSK